MRHRFLNCRYQANALIENWLQAILRNRDSGLLAQTGLLGTYLAYSFPMADNSDEASRYSQTLLGCLLAAKATPGD
jgi:hypothetical protein